MPPCRTLLEIDGHVVAADVHLRGDGRPPVLFLHGLLKDSPANGTSATVSGLMSDP